MLQYIKLVNHKLRILGTLLFIFFSLIHSQSQSIPQFDITKIKVDQLTDAQIKKIVKKAESSGLTEDQMGAMALSRGMSPGELEKLKDRISKLNLDQNLHSSTSNRVAGNPRRQISAKQLSQGLQQGIQQGTPSANNQLQLQVDSTKLFESVYNVQADTAFENLRKKIFGYNLFFNKQLTFEPSLNIPTPKDYQLGAGDVITIDIWGASQQNYNLTISPDGSIIVDNIGPINISGLTIDKASAKIISRLSSIYSGITGKSPNTFAQVSLGSLRSILVSLVGEVNNPGTYTLPSLATVFNALYLSGGPSLNGSMRNIQVYRDNKLLTTLDIYDFLVNGDQKNNIRLQDQDIIMIKPYITRIELQGEIKTPALFEIKPSEFLSDLLKFSGGFTDKAYSHRLKIDRNTDRQHKIIDVLSSQFTTTKLEDGDYIKVEPIIDRYENRVEIEGAVNRSGKFELDPGMKVKDLIDKSEGLREDAFLNRAILYRLDENLTVQSTPIDLHGVLKGDSSNLILIKDDFIKVYSIFDLKEQYNVQIDGEVSKPDNYSYIKNMTLSDIIAIAGGFKESASLARIEIARRIKNNDTESRSNKIATVFTFTVTKELLLADSASGFELQPFDRIFVRRSPGYEVQTLATINGEVNFPGLYSIVTKDEKISDLVYRAGGLTKEAYPKGAKLIRKLTENQKERLKILKSIETQATDSIKIQVNLETEQAIGIDLEQIIKTPHSKFDLILQEGDQLYIPKELQTVRLSGAFLYPITVRYDKTYGFSKYAALAGGYAEDALPKNAYVIYANGSVDRTSSFLGIKAYPTIEPGAEIIVPKKVEEEKISKQEALAISTALTSLALIIVTIISKL
jgi:protein involved in polysaccharide export with SLBB domain